MGSSDHQHVIPLCIVMAAFVCKQVSPQAWTLSNLLMSGTKATYQGLGYADTIALGAQRGLDECRKQFQWSIWNCPQNVFTQIFSKNNPMPTNRETAFVHAIISAGIVHTVTRNCSKGQFDKCRCDPSKSGKGDSASSSTKGLFRWGGCSDDIEFGMNLAKSFLDERETGHDPKALINLHNNNVGRMAVKNTMEITCKCHGVSGSCTTKTCWMRVAEFSVIGNYLKDAYAKALKLSSSANGFKNKERVRKGIADQLSVASISTVAGINDNTSPSKSRLEQEMANLPVTRLAFAEDPPDYCTSSINATMSSRGTVGRICSRRKGKDVPSEERRSCRNLCKACGLKVRKQRKKVTTTCNCKFHWCCQVHCGSCQQEETTFTCAE